MPDRKVSIALIKNALRLVILALVAWGIWHTIGKARAEFAAKEFSVSALQWQWMVAAAVLYLIGLLPCAFFWYSTMRAMRQTPHWRSTLRAYFIGHLGKYVPGKALVVILRTALIRGQQVDTVVAATAVFVETLTMMAVGAATATICLMIGLPEMQVRLYVLAVGILLATGIPTLPPIFQRVVRLIRLSKAQPAIQELVKGINYRLMVGGWIKIGLGWILLGGSLWATVCAMPESFLVRPSLQDLPLMIATVALAMVAGFLSLLPGGIGVREWVVMTILSPVLGPSAAIVSAILLRIVWLFAELVVSGILWKVSIPGERPVE